MSDTLKAFQSTTVVGLGTWTHTALNTSMYYVSCQSTENPPSSLSITISQTGSTSVSVTSTVPAAGQIAINLSKIFNCVAGDVLSVAISSSAPIDQQLNTVKSTIVVRIGQ